MLGNVVVCIVMFFFCRFSSLSFRTGSFRQHAKWLGTESPAEHVGRGLRSIRALLL